MIILDILAIILIFILPIFIVKLTRVNKILSTVGAITLCYLAGFAFSTIGFTGFSYDKGLTETIAYVLVAISLPLVLFSIDLKSIKNLAKNTIIGFSLCIISALVGSFVMFIIYKNVFKEAAILSAMTVGLYTGGTPNMNAIGASFNIGGSIISAANLSDTVVGGIYFLLLISVFPRLYNRIFRKNTKNNYEKAENVNATDISQTAASDYKFNFSIKDKKKVLKLLLSFGLSILCIGVGAIIELIIDGTIGTNLLYILLSVSILGVIFSFIKPIREIEGSYTLGMYLILMFSLALSMSIDWSVFLSDILPVILFFASAQTFVIGLHLLLCRIFKIDAGTAIITSTAGVYGPPFIAPVAKAAGREDLIAPGIICGALGLAIGTILGYGIGLILLLF